jgi:hypothetical protein
MGASNIECRKVDMPAPLAGDIKLAALHLSNKALAFLWIAGFSTNFPISQLTAEAIAWGLRKQAGYHVDAGYNDDDVASMVEKIRDELNNRGIVLP